MSYTRKFLSEALRSIDSATFTGSYQNLGTPLDNPCSILKLVNNSTVFVTVSEDGGVTDHDVAPASSFYLYDVTSDSPQEAGSIFISKGTQISVKGSAGTGSVYLVAKYVQQLP
jgi:hypothetical protein